MGGCKHIRPLDMYASLFIYKYFTILYSENVILPKSVVFVSAGYKGIPFSIWFKPLLPIILLVLIFIREEKG